MASYDHGRQTRIDGADDEVDEAGAVDHAGDVEGDGDFGDILELFAQHLCVEVTNIEFGDQVVAALDLLAAHLEGRGHGAGDSGDLGVRDILLHEGEGLGDDGFAAAEPAVDHGLLGQHGERLRDRLAEAAEVFVDVAAGAGLDLDRAGIETRGVHPSEFVRASFRDLGAGAEDEV